MKTKPSQPSCSKLTNTTRKAKGSSQKLQPNQIAKQLFNADGQLDLSSVSAEHTFRGKNPFFNKVNDSSDESTTDSDCDSQKDFKNIITMPTPPTPNVLKKEYLDMVPEFSGQQELLPRFLEICEKLVKKFYNATDVEDFQNEYLMASIRAKIKGEAETNISSCTINTWSDLKNALINCYSDKRDCFTLQIELTELKQLPNESPFDFFNKIQKLLNLQTTYVITHFNEQSSVLTTYLRQYALRILLRGLRDPIGPLMRTKNPTDLNQALNMLTNDFQLEVKSKQSNNVHNLPNFPNKSMRKLNTNYNATPSHKPFNFQPKPMFNFQSNQFSNLNRQPTQRQPNNPFTNRNTQPSKTPSRQNTPYKPTPMSISTRNTFQRPSTQQNYSFRPNEPKFISEELFNIDQQNIESNYETIPPEDYEENSQDVNYEVETDQDDFLDESASDPNLNC